jgi:hypothetical protein
MKWGHRTWIAVIISSFFGSRASAQTQAEWGRETFGGTATDHGCSVQQTRDRNGNVSGYIIAGTTESFGNGASDIWLIKTDIYGKADANFRTVDGNGNTYDGKTFGSDGAEYAAGVHQTGDGGYIIVGSTAPSGSPFWTDVFVIKTDNSGNCDDGNGWTRTFGEPGSVETGFGIQETGEGYIIAANNSSGVWLIKIDASGNLLSSTSISVSGGYRGHDFQKADNNGFIIVGERTSATGVAEIVLVKFKSDGSKDWEMSYTGNGVPILGTTVQQVKSAGSEEPGYIISGSIGVFGETDAVMLKTDISGHEKWRKTFGGPSRDHAGRIQQTNDGGYIFTGTTSTQYWQSSDSGQWKKDYKPDVWLIKTDASGNRQWEKTFGGKSTDLGTDVRQTDDGGYIILGSTISYATCTVRTSPVLTPEGIKPITRTVCEYDVWLIKTDRYGNCPWNVAFGGMGKDTGYSVQEVMPTQGVPVEYYENGGYVIAGSTTSSQNGLDMCLIKTDNLGYDAWGEIQTFGGGQDDEGYSIQHTSDGGYIIVGYTKSFGAGGKDVYLVKTGRFGEKLWEKYYGGPADDEGFSVREIAGGGYIIAGYTESYGAGGSDVWLIKTDANGDPDPAFKTCDPQGNALYIGKTFGGTVNDLGYEVQQVTGGDFIIVGTVNGVSDVYLIRTDSNGENGWDKRISRTDYEEGYSFQQVIGDGYLVVGSTMPLVGTNTDVYLIKIDASGGPPVWEKQFDGGGKDYGYSLQKARNGGYIMACMKRDAEHTVGDIWLIKTDDSGNRQWDKIFGNGSARSRSGLQLTSDGGYIIGGTLLTPSESRQIWLIKTFDEPLALAAPQPGQVFGAPPLFKWNPGRNDRFKVQVSLFSNFSELKCWSGELTSSEWKIPIQDWDPISSGATIYWRIKGWYSGDNPLFYEDSEAWGFIKQ